MSEDKLKNNLHIQNQVAVFTAFALKKYPDCLPTFEIEYPKSSQLRKQLISNAIYLAELRFPETFLKPNLVLKSLGDIKLVSRPQNAETMRKNAVFGDYLWTAFRATGETQYIVKILEYLREEDQIVKSFSYEIINRENAGPKNPFNTKQVFDRIKTFDQKGKKHLLGRVLSYQPILWSALEQPEHISKKIDEILKTNPKLKFIFKKSNSLMRERSL